MDCENTNEILRANQRNYADLYAKQQAFLRYPADWIVRFHNMYLKKHLPTGNVLDYGCGGGNNACFFIEKGYKTWGVDVTPNILPLVRQNLRERCLDPSNEDRFSIINVESPSLRFADGFFDLCVSNQVLYYLPTEAAIHQVCREIRRALRPGGLVFFTMMGPKNYYIQGHTKAVLDEHVHDIRIEDPTHRLAGVRELIYLIRNEDHLKRVFSEFEPITLGYFEQRMFDMTSNFHWIFVGQKTS